VEFVSNPCLVGLLFLLTMKPLLFAALLIPLTSLVSRAALTEIAWVDRAPVYAEEIQQEISNLRAIPPRERKDGMGSGVANKRGCPAHGAGDPDGGLFRQAFANVERRKIEGLMALELGIEATMDYAGILENYGKYIDSRSKDVDAGKVIYGPARPSLRAYLGMLHNDLVLLIKHKLQDAADFNESDLRSAYERVKDPKYRHKGEARVMCVDLTNFTPAEREAIRARILEYSQRGDELQQNTEKLRDDLRRLIQDSGSHEAKITLEEYGEELLEGSARGPFPLAEAAYELKSGEVSRLIQAGGRYHLILGLGRAADYYSDYESVRMDIVRGMVAKSYSEKVEKRLSAARVRWVKGERECCN